MTNSSDLCVVLGASGALGSALVRRLATGGMRVRAVNRSGRIEVPDGVDIERADGADPVSIRRACDDATVIFHCINLPFLDGPRAFPPVTNAVIEAAAAADARLVFGDNLHMYGRVTDPITEGLAYRATDATGVTRSTMARAVIAAHRAGRIRATIGRASDVYGPGVTRSMLGHRVFRAALTGGTAEILGDADALHTYTFIDDFASALVTLAERDEALGQVWHVPSAETLTTRQMLTSIFAEAGTPLRVKATPTWRLTIGGLFDPWLRERRESRHRYRDPFIVDHSKFARAFGASTTPHIDAVRQTLDWHRGQAMLTRSAETSS
jgi:nucleoside-diphosphate-sugar epimerase